MPGALPDRRFWRAVGAASLETDDLSSSSLLSFPAVLVSTSPSFVVWAFVVVFRSACVIAYHAVTIGSLGHRTDTDCHHLQGNNLAVE